MSSAGAQAVVVARPLPCCWPCRPSAWASIGLIWAISSCALRRSWNGSHRVMVAIWPPSFVGRAARRLGENADRVVERRAPTEPTYSIVNTVQCQDRRSGEVNMREGSVPERAKAPPSKRATATSGEPATDGRSRSLWFNAPRNDQDRRPQLTRERVVAEALTVIAQDGVQALTMRTLAAPGGPPSALYHHVHKEQLQGLVLDAALAEVDATSTPPSPGPSSSSCSPIGCTRCSSATPASPRSSRPATRSGRTPSPWPRRSLHHCRLPGSATTRPAWPSSSWSTTPPASRSAPPPPSTSSASATRPPEPSCTSSSARCPPTASPPWSPSAPTSGSTTATSGSPPAWTSSSTGWSTRGAPPTDRRSQDDRPPPLSDHVKKHDRRWMNDPQGGSPMS